MFEDFFALKEIGFYLTPEEVEEEEEAEDGDGNAGEETSETNEITTENSESGDEGSSVDPAVVLLIIGIPLFGMLIVCGIGYWCLFKRYRDDEDSNKVGEMENAPIGKADGDSADQNFKANP